VTAPQILVHTRRDNVGVVVVEDLGVASDALCVVTEDDSEFRLALREAVPLGHKVALADLAPGDTVLKYGEDIGRIVAPVARGAHVHVHNLRTKRW
jgi:(2R)-sulfolactate sulfo-lyase subunit alpha